MKLIFLDIDGVLNYSGAKETYKGAIGILDEKLALLKHIIEKTGAKVVLTSTWKTDWEDTPYIEDLNPYGRYLVKKFKSYHIPIIGKTYDDWVHRGAGIIEFMKNTPQVDSFCILDDEMFDYVELGLHNYLVKTSFYANGLLPEHTDLAINILNTHSKITV